MNWKRYLSSAVGAATVLTSVVVVDQLLASNAPQAQTAPRPATPAPQQRKPATPATAATPAAPAASETPAAPSVPQRLETINYDAWTVTCRDTLEKFSKKICSGTMQVVEQKSRQVLMAWVIGRDNQGVLRTVIQTPTGVQIPRGLQLALGKSPTRTLPYVACEPQRCEASMAMDDAMVNDAIASQDVTATIVAVDGRSINFKMQAKGIDKVFAAIGRP